MVKKSFLVFKTTFSIGLLFWIIETIIFQIIYGFHWRAVNKYELWCDRASLLIIFIGFLVLVFTASLAIGWLIKQIEEEEK